MFTSLTLHGSTATLLHGHQPAADLSAWRIAKHEGQWTLTATIARKTFYLGKRPLLFTAPRDKGWWAWGVEAIDVGDRTLRARLGPPEQ